MASSSLQLNPNLCFILSKLFPEVNRLALDAGVSSWSRVKEATFFTQLKEEEVIETKCRLTADTLAYILSFTDYHEKKPLAWWVRLRGLNYFNQPTSVGHAFVLLERHDNTYLFIDSYIGCRGLTCREVDINALRKLLSRLEDKYEPEIWYQVTGCHEEEVPDHVKVTLDRYSYNDREEDILTRIEELKYFRPDIIYGHHIE